MDQIYLYYNISLPSCVNKDKEKVRGLSAKRS